MAVMDEGPDAEDLARAAVTLARRFASGATMWCVAPEWPSHARHVAAEFVRPAIVGKRALPAVAVSPPGQLGRLRATARPGDVVLAIGTDGDAGPRRLLRYAEAWGLTRIWLGTGANPEPGAAEHVLWLDGVDPLAATREDDLVLACHLLWELTHVVLERPDLVAAEDRCEGDRCVTCSDEARPAYVLSLDQDGSAAVLAGGRKERVDVSLVEAVALGDLVLAHAGVAVTVIERAAP